MKSITFKEKMTNMYDKFEYALQLAFQFPEADINEDGTVYEMPHHSYLSFEAFADKDNKELGISEESFYNQDSIIPVLEAYSLDKVKFWYAVAYVMSLTKTWAKYHVISTPLPTATEQLTKMRDEIKDRHEFKILIDNPTESHTVVIAGNRLVRKLLVNALDELIEKESLSDMADSNELPIWREASDCKKTEQTWYAANMFSLLLKCLKLPVIRSRSIRKEFRDVEGGIVQVKGKDAEVSYDKNQLIAELIHFLDLTDNQDLDGNSIKAILNSKRNLNGIGFF